MAIKYKWLAARLREQLPDYATQGRHRLPTETELAAHYQVSRQTVRQALAVLTQEGLIESRQGSGSYLTGRLWMALIIRSGFCFRVIHSISIRRFCMICAQHCMQKDLLCWSTKRKKNFPRSGRSLPKSCLIRHAHSLWIRSKARFLTRTSISTTHFLRSPFQLYLCVIHIRSLTIVPASWKTI